MNSVKNSSLDLSKNPIAISKLYIGKVKELNTALEQVVTKGLELQSQNATLTSEKETLNFKITELNTLNQDQLLKIQTLTQQCQSTTQAQELVESTLITTKGQLQQVTTANERLNAELTTTKETNSSLLKEIEKLKSQMAELSTQIKDKDRKNQELQLEVEKQTKAWSSLETELSSIQMPSQQISNLLTPPSKH